MRVRFFVPCDAGALAVGADEVAAAIRKAGNDRKLEVDIVRTGSRGLYWLEPMVEVTAVTEAWNELSRSDGKEQSKRSSSQAYAVAAVQGFRLASNGARLPRPRRRKNTSSATPMRVTAAHSQTE